MNIYLPDFIVYELADARRWETESLSFHTTKQTFVYAKVPNQKVYSLRVCQEKTVLVKYKKPDKIKLFVVQVLIDKRQPRLRSIQPAT